MIGRRDRRSWGYDAVELIGAFAEQYGQFGSAVPTKPHDLGGYDNSFLVADPRESWVVEAVGRRWLARRFGQGTTSISNQPTIRTTWDLGSADVVDYAVEMGGGRRIRRPALILLAPTATTAYPARFHSSASCAHASCLPNSKGRFHLSG